MNFSLNGIFPKTVLKKSSRSSLGRASWGCVAGVDSQIVLWSPQARASVAREGVLLVRNQVGSFSRHWQLCPRWVLFLLHPKISLPGHMTSGLTILVLILCACSVTSVMSNFFNPLDCTHQAPLSARFSRQEYWSGWPCLPPGDLPNPGIKPMSLVPPELAGGFFTL